MRTFYFRVSRSDQGNESVRTGLAGTQRRLQRPLYRKRIVNPRGPSDQSCHQVVRGRGKVEEEGRLTKRRALASRCFWRICRELIAGHGVQVIEAIAKGLTPVVSMSTVELRTRKGLYMKLNRAVSRTDV